MTAQDLRDTVARVRAACSDLSLEDQLTTLQIAWLITASLVRGEAEATIPDEYLSEAQTEQLFQLQDMSDDVARDFPDRSFVRLYETGNLEVVWQERALRTPGAVDGEAQGRAGLLDVIGRIVAETEGPAARAIQETTSDREFIEDLRGVRLSDLPEVPEDEDIVEWHTFSGRLIDEREVLATALQGIGQALNFVDITRRSRHVGPGGSDDPTQTDGE